MAGSALLLPAQGHAPYLIGVGLLRSLALDICLPEYYGDDQQNILRDKFPDDGSRIFLSRPLGKLMEPLLAGRKGSSKRIPSSDVDSYARSVRQHAGGIGAALERMLDGGIEAISLAGTRKTFSQFDFALNLGLPVRSPVEPVFFVFASKMSEIYRVSPYQSSGVAFLTQTWKELESSFSRMFIPRLHSLCHRKQFDATGVTFTPPFAQPEPVNLDDSVRSDSTLVVVSGTGMEVRKLLRLVRASTGPWITLPESPKTLPAGRVPRKSPHVWGHPNVMAVIARSGLGSIWQAVLNQKPMGVVRPDVRTDPEVYHNAKMVEQVGIGTVLDKSMEPLLGDLPRFRSALQEQVQREQERFGTMNGIEYTSAALGQLLSGQLSSKTAAFNSESFIEGVRTHESLLAG